MLDVAITITSRQGPLTRHTIDLLEAALAAHHPDDFDITVNPTHPGHATGYLTGGPVDPDELTTALLPVATATNTTLRFDFDVDGETWSTVVDNTGTATRPTPNANDLLDLLQRVAVTVATHHDNVNDITALTAALDTYATRAAVVDIALGLHSSPQVRRLAQPRNVA